MQLGAAAAEAYGRLRMDTHGGREAEMSDLLLGLSTELMAFDFRYNTLVCGGGDSGGRSWWKGAS